MGGIVSSSSSSPSHWLKKRGFTGPSTPQVRSSDGVTLLPIHVAAASGDLAIVQFLHSENCCDMRAPNSLGEQALHLAAGSGSLSICQYLCEECGCGGDLRIISSKNGTSVVHAAAREGRAAIIEWLLRTFREEAAAHAKMQRVATARVRAARERVLELKDEERKRADRDDENDKDEENEEEDDDEDEIMENREARAASEKMLEEAKRDLKRSSEPLPTAPLDLPDGHGDTPSHLAALCGDVTSLQLIIRHRNGAKPTTTTTTTTCTATLTANPLNADGSSLVHYAAIGGSVDCLRFVLDHCLAPAARHAAVLVADRCGDRPLRLAAHWGNPSCCAELVVHGALEAEAGEEEEEKKFNDEDLATRPDVVQEILPILRNTLAYYENFRSTILVGCLRKKSPHLSKLRSEKSNKKKKMKSKAGLHNPRQLIAEFSGVVFGPRLHNARLAEARLGGGGWREGAWGASSS